MEVQKLTAIIRDSRLGAVEDRLIECGVGGITVTPVQGFGEYTDFFSPDRKVRHVQLQVYTTADDADELIEVIRDVAHTGGAGDGLIAVEPVLRLIRVRSAEDSEEVR